jgi:hypothetical protein
VIGDEQLVMSNMHALCQLGKRTGEVAAVDALLEERPMLLQLQVHNWLDFLTAYGVRVRAAGQVEDNQGSTTRLGACTKGAMGTRAHVQAAREMAAAGTCGSSPVPVHIRRFTSM